MIRSILAAFLLCVLVAGIVIWIVRGGPQRLFSTELGGTQFISNPLDFFMTGGSASGTPFQLPWQPTTNAAYGVQLDLGVYANESLPTGEDDPDFGKKIHLKNDTQGMQTDDPNSEYVTIEAGPETSDIGGWSLRSAKSGVRAYLGGGQIYLAPGTHAEIFSGISLAGTGFSNGVLRINLGSSFELWNNEHDTIELINTNGSTIDTISY